MRNRPNATMPAHPVPPLVRRLVHQEFLMRGSRDSRIVCFICLSRYRLSGEASTSAQLFSGFSPGRGQCNHLLRTQVNFLEKEQQGTPWPQLPHTLETISTPPHSLEKKNQSPHPERGKRQKKIIRASRSCHCLEPLQSLPRNTMKKTWDLPS